jgi:hypothetical protein
MPVIMPTTIAMIAADIGVIITTYIPIATVGLFITFAATASGAFWLLGKAFKSGR